MKNMNVIGLVGGVGWLCFVAGSLVGSIGDVPSAEPLTTWDVIGAMVTMTCTWLLGVLAAKR